MTQDIYNPNPGFSNPHIKDFDEYLNLYKESIENPEKFFGDLAKENISWIEDFKEVHNSEFQEAKWFVGGKTNITLNCIDRHLEKNGDKIALIWELSLIHI